MDKPRIQWVVSSKIVCLLRTLKIKSFSEIIKMISYWIRMGPKSNDSHPYKRRGHTEIGTEKAISRQRQRLEYSSHKPKAKKDSFLEPSEQTWP